MGGRTSGYSLKRRLLASLLGVLAVLGIGLFWLVDAYAGHAADRAYDRLLQGAALAIADTVAVADGRLTVDLPYAALGILAMARRDRVFYRIDAPDGRLITGYGDLSVPPAMAPRAKPRFLDAAYRGAPVRVAVLGRLVPDPEVGGWVTIMVAQTRAERDAFAREILRHAFAPIALVMAVGAALIWIGVQRALAPLAQLERLVSARQPADLRPIDVAAPIEVRQLLQALNHFMLRLEASLRAMQSFLADAAHQIRTPLASLRAQADLAVEEKDVALLRAEVAKIHRNAATASQITNQLLSHAMVTHRGALQQTEPVDLAALVRQAAERAKATSEATIAVAIAGNEDLAPIRGDAVILREALANLIDNAVKYGCGRPVEIRLGRGAEPRRVRLEVLDRGPGIPDREKPKVVERFSRGSGATGVAGSGLGLAIVKAVAEAHGATVELLDRPGGGLMVRLEFEAAPARLSGSPALRRAALVAVMLTLWLPPALSAAEPHIYAAPATELARLRIYGATDLPAMEPVILDFQAVHPEVAVEYVELETAELYRSVIDPQVAPAPDVVISSAVDLQVKLVNDGYTQPHRSAATEALPDWANWRDEAFGFTYEPAVIVYNREQVPEAEVPRSRPALIRLLQEQAERYRGRVATYDIARSGVGYLFAAEDEVQSGGSFWRLMSSLGQEGVHLACCTGDVLAAIERGEVLLGYNLLGSYARARQLAGAPIGIVLPQDYTLVIARVAVIPVQARNSGLAGQFIDYLLSARGQTLIATRADLYAIMPGVRGELTADRLAAEAVGPLQPITLGPALLTFLDRLKKAQFLADWRLAIQPP